MEAELLRIVQAAAPTDQALPPDLEEEVAILESSSDGDLWRAARTCLSAEESARLESLHLQQQDTGLNGDEKSEVEELLRKYERSILIRSQALGLLQQRGHDVTELLARQ
jgi:hypothetical protein